LIKAPGQRHDESNRQKAVEWLGVVNNRTWLGHVDEDILAQRKEKSALMIRRQCRMCRYGARMMEHDGNWCVDKQAVGRCKFCCQGRSVK
jgi:hypothetical protein